MRAIRITGLCLLGALALSAFAAASASASPPEFGRCLKQAGGKFENASCTKEGPAGTHEWSAGVVKNKFTTADQSGTLVVFETVAGAKITCTGESDTGEFTGVKTTSLKLRFTGCETGGLKCNSAGEPVGVIVTAPLQGEVGTIKLGEPPTKSKVGLRLAPVAGEAFVEFECSVDTKIAVHGSVIGSVSANSMKTSYTISFKMSKAKQIPERFEGRPLSVLEWSLNGGLSERVGLSFVMILTTEEKVEVSTVN